MARCLHYLELHLYFLSHDPGEGLLDVGSHALLQPIPGLGSACPHLIDSLVCRDKPGIDQPGIHSGSGKLQGQIVHDLLPDFVFGFDNRGLAQTLATATPDLDILLLLDYTARMDDKSLASHLGYLLAAQGLPVSATPVLSDPHTPTQGDYDARWRVRINLSQAQLHREGIGICGPANRCNVLWLLVNQGVNAPKGLNQAKLDNLSLCRFKKRGGPL